MAPRLYVIHHRDYSGAETSQEVVIRSDPDALVACPPDSPSEQFARRLGAKTTPLGYEVMRHSAGPVELLRSFYRGVRGALDLRRALRRHSERELIYAIGIRSGLLAAIAAIGLRRRVVWSVTDLLPPWPLKPLVRAVAAMRVERAVCLSAYIATDLVGRSRRLSERTSVVNPGVELDRFAPVASSENRPRAAIVGHISRVKRTELALDVAELVLAREPRFSLRVIGAAQFNPENEALERELRARVGSDPALSVAVEFAGRRPDVAAALSGCGALLHCREDEPFGMVLVEAMAMALPVVAPASGGALEIVEDGVTGWLYRPQDPADAAEKLLSLLGDPDSARSMGAAGRARVERSFSSTRQLALTTEMLAAGN